MTEAETLSAIAGILDSVLGWTPQVPTREYVTRRVSELASMVHHQLRSDEALRQARWHATYNAALTGAMSLRVRTTDALAPGAHQAIRDVAQAHADAVHGAFTLPEETDDGPQAA